MVRCCIFRIDQGIPRDLSLEKEKANCLSKQFVWDICRRSKQADFTNLKPLKAGGIVGCFSLGEASNPGEEPHPNLDVIGFFPPRTVGVGCDLVHCMALKEPLRLFHCLVSPGNDCALMNCPSHHLPFDSIHKIKEEPKKKNEGDLFSLRQTHSCAPCEHSRHRTPSPLPLDNPRNTGV